MTGIPKEYLGGKFLVSVNTSGDDDNPTWTHVGGQRKGNFGRKADVVKAQHKDSFPWYRKVYGYIDWTFDFDGVWLQDNESHIQDEGIKKMQELWNAQEDAYVRISTPPATPTGAVGDGSNYYGHAVIADFTLDGPHDNVVTYTGKLEGNGSYLFVE